MKNRLGNQGKKNISALDQFMAFVNKTDTCWLWMGAKNDRGYGKIARTENGKRKHYGAHQFSYLLFKGPIIDGLFVCHNCAPNRDNPACVNPNHLWLGNASENIKDAVKKGTYKPPKWDRNGSRNPAAKLTEEKVREMRAKYATGLYTQKRLGAEYGINQRTACQILRGEKWQTVENPYPQPLDNQAIREMLSAAHQGEKGSRTKVSEAQVLEMREKHKAGMKIFEIAKLYPILSMSGVGQIIRKKSWAHLP